MLKPLTLSCRYLARRKKTRPAFDYGIPNHPIPERKKEREKEREREREDGAISAIPRHRVDQSERGRRWVQLLLVGELKRGL